MLMLVVFKCLMGTNCATRLQSVTDLDGSMLSALTNDISATMLVMALCSCQYAEANSGVGFAA